MAEISDQCLFKGMSLSCPFPKALVLSFLLIPPALYNPCLPQRLGDEVGHINP